MNDSDQHFSEVARESVEVFDEIYRKASQRLAAGKETAGSALAAGNTFVDGRPFDRERDIHIREMEGLRALSRAPAIARVVARDGSGDEHVYYISGQTSIQLDGGRTHASYRSPIGRLASLPPGEECTVSVDRAGTSLDLEVLEIARYRPAREQDRWDSKPVSFEGFEFDLISYTSLQSLLKAADPADLAAELEALLSGEGSVERLQGLRHEVRSAMALREQPILDRFQDEIFRLPLGSGLMILGPPGTGKTTTLIKRLGQKLDREFLTAEEARMADQVDSPDRPYVRSWLMFTPTDLLKHYVREAFNREQVPATDSHIQTWDSMRVDLGRQVLGVLQSANSSGKFVRSSSRDAFLPAVLHDPTPWFEDFQEFHQQRILQQLRDGLEMLEPLENESNATEVAMVRNLMQEARASRLVAIFEGLERVEPSISPLLKRLKDLTDKSIREQLALTFNRDRTFLHQLAEFLTSLQADEEEEADDDEFDDDLSESGPASTSVQKAVVVYRQTLRSLARARYQRRSIPPTARARKVADWLGEHRLPSREKLLEIGENIAVQNAFRRFVHGHRRFVMDAPASYRAFRKSSLAEQKWYQGVPENQRRISDPELDGVILLMLRCARSLYQSATIRRQLDEPRFQYLKSISGSFRAQILVDEATDFSPIQLACMYALSRPETASFFACGDFNQRITSWGTRSIEQFSWSSPGFESKTIKTVYRQSRLLNEFSNSLLEVFNGDRSAGGAVPEHILHEGVAPVLAEDLLHGDDIGMWLFERIAELERMIGDGAMPSIAVLVNSEEQVGPVAEAMNVLLEEINREAVPCRDGQALGQISQIRVFDVRHIKGLEFEAVFFVGIDDLVESLPELFEKYLYVGATRAATYFGAVCHGKLPVAMEPLRRQFAKSWNGAEG